VRQHFHYDGVYALYACPSSKARHTWYITVSSYSNMPY